MATRKIEDFAFGGIDSRSNPTNFPPDRSLRCLNWTPMQNGSLRLRSGYTVPTTDGGNATPIHSMVYYEQYAASYLGPQFVLFGKGTNIKQYALSGGAVTTPGTFGTSNPWGHFRSGNRVFLADGVTAQNWDGVTMRTTGIPGADTFVTGASNYCTLGVSVAGGNPTWSNPGNITGAPDNVYATVTLASGFSSQYLQGTGYGYAIASTGRIKGISVQIKCHVSAVSTGAALPYVQVALMQNGVRVTAYKTITVADGLALTDVTFTLGSSIDLWGVTWSPGLINSATFGVQVLAAITGPASAGNITFSVDSVQTTVSATSLTGVTVSTTASTQGSIAPTQLTGYQLYAAVYNPITQHMGNRQAIGNLQTLSATLSVFVVSGLPILASFNSEWVWAVGMTNDGGQIPYWFGDAQNNNVVIGNDASMGTVYIGNVNAQEELPVRNDVPPALDKFARVGTRIFGHLSGNQYLNYSNDVADISNANYVGKPEESWPADQTEPLPTGKQPTSIHAYRLEGWFFDKDYLSIWSQFLKQQGANPWRGPWPGGCCGQRAFVETPYGPFWISPQKELCTFMSDGVISASDEYEASLLHKLHSASMGSVEIAYINDPENLIDEIMIRGLDKDGNTVVVIHDFMVRDDRSMSGQGYQYAYTGATIQTFAGAGFTPRQNVYASNGKMRLWAGTKEGFIAQLEDGNSDNSADYSGDYLALVNLGPNRPTLAELEIQGDSAVQVSYSLDYSNSDLTGFLPTTAEQIPGETSRYGFKMYGEGRWLYIRLQLTSHPADGDFTLSDPPYLGIPVYGVINMSILKLGLDRKEGR